MANNNQSSKPTSEDGNRTIAFGDTQLEVIMSSDMSAMFLKSS